MRLLIAALLIGATALPLAACDKDSADKGDQANVAVRAPVETPKRKPGLWKQTMLIEGLDVVQSAKLCLDEATDSKVSWWAQQGVRSGCAKNDVQRQPDGSWKFSSVCQMEGGIRMVTEGSAVGDFDSKYEVKAETTTSGAPMAQMNGTRTVTIDAEWQGPCPADMKPGDMELPDGRRMNMLAMAAPAGAQP
ncbi:MAG: DUF3617 domain-containing protein [Parcubacteria group bacterium]